MKFVRAVLFAIQICLLANVARSEEDDGDESKSAPDFEVVSTDAGDIRGFREASSKGNVFYSFLGIPYAKPPIGDLRFKDPEVLVGWDGERDGSVAPPPCAQINVDEFVKKPTASFDGQEDCLYLNIYSPMPNIKYAELPVMVYIHGGHFASGRASDYKPYHFLDYPVVLVVIQYRLGVLGFLSTEDEVIPGNFGLKDQTMAIAWLHRNIDNFGGSRFNINLFGSGSGAASVHYQTLSHHTIGLFKGAILQSGTAICPWAKGGVHKEAAYHLAKHFKCFPDKDEKEDVTLEDKEDKKEEGEVEDKIKEVITDEPGDKEKEITENDAKNEDEQDKIKTEGQADEGVKETAEESEMRKKNEELLRCLQSQDVEKMTKSIELFYIWAYLPLLFGPRVDFQFLPESPEFLLMNGRHKRVNLIVGINKDDGSHLTNSVFVSEGRRMALKHHFPLTGPVSLEFSDQDVAPLNMSIKAYDKYLGQLAVDAPDAHNLTRLFTDRHFGVCSDLTAEMHHKNNIRYKKNVFFYELHHRGQKSTGDEFGLNFGQEWVSYGDELYYLFPDQSAAENEADEDDRKVSELMINMWVNFAATGNPTPNGTTDFKWEPFTKESRHHLKITTTPAMEPDAREEVREFWTSLPTRQNLYFFKDRFAKLFRNNVTDSGTGNEEKDGDKKETHEETTAKEEL